MRQSIDLSERSSSCLCLVTFEFFCSRMLGVGDGLAVNGIKGAGISFDKMVRAKLEFKTGIEIICCEVLTSAASSIFRP